jgi:hypothetical protein
VLAIMPLRPRVESGLLRCQFQSYIGTSLRAVLVRAGAPAAGPVAGEGAAASAAGARLARLSKPALKERRLKPLSPFLSFIAALLRT